MIENSTLTFYWSSGEARNLAYISQHTKLRSAISAFMKLIEEDGAKPENLWVLYADEWERCGVWAKGDKWLKPGFRRGFLKMLKAES